MIKIVNENLNPAKITTSSNDCYIRAISKILDLPWDNVYIQLFNIGFEKKMGMNHHKVLCEFLKRYDYSCRIMREDDRKPLDIFLSNLSDGKYIIGTNNHCFAFIDGTVYDKNLDQEYLSTHNIIYYFHKVNRMVW